MKIIGITGGIGSGKTEVLNYLKEKGAFVLEADSIAHELMLPGMETYKKIVFHFGEKILLRDGHIDRQKLGGIVFLNETELNTLNNIVHPAVKNYIINDISEKKKSGLYHLYIIEAALLIQDGYREICDELWYVFVKKEERIRRLVVGRGGDSSKYEAVIKSQDPDDYYINNCDVVIDNNGPFEKTKSTLNGLLNKSISCGTISR